MTYIDRLHAQAKETVGEFIEVNSIDQYVSTCLNRVGIEGLKLIAEQGGVIYSYQGGLTPLNFPLKPNGKDFYSFVSPKGIINISYGLVPVSQNYCLSYNPQNIITAENISDDIYWEYPVARVPLIEFKDLFWSHSNKGCLKLTNGVKDLQKSGYLGYSRFPTLCTKESSSSYQVHGMVSICPTKYQESRDLNVIKEYPSIESQLESYVKSNMPSCFNVSYYEKQGNDISINYAKSNASVFFINSQGVRFHLDFPFEVSIEGQKPIVEFVEFQQIVPSLNFIDTYNFLYDTFFEMARNPLFNFKNEDYKNDEYYDLPNYNKLSYKPSFKIEYIEGECAGCDPYSSSLDDVISITDLDTDLDGETYTFYVALKQRNPVLDLISNPDTTFPYPVNGEDMIMDYLLYKDEILEIRPEAMDPNYDSFKINFSGWKETTDSIFDIECCLADDTCNFLSHAQCIIDSSKDEYENLNIDCCRSGYYAGTCNVEILKFSTSICKTSHYEPHKFSKSFEENDGVLIYTIQETDLGFHEFVVIVEDEHGAMDFQTVRVFVYDTPLAVLKPQNVYGDVNNFFASIEDPYILDARSSKASVFDQENAESKFVYRIPLENDFEKKLDEPILNLPLGDFSFRTILPRLFNYSTFDEFGVIIDSNDNKLLTLNVELSVEQKIDDVFMPSPVSITEIYVSECLPHGFKNLADGFRFEDDDALNYYNVTAYGADRKSYYEALLDDDISQDIVFDYPHICCKPHNIAPGIQELTSGSFADTDILCYRNENYQTCYPLNKQLQQSKHLTSGLVLDRAGEIIDFSESEHYDLFGTRIDYYPPKNIAEDPYPVFTNADHFGDAINDIFNLTFQQYCSGRRGNVCSGKIEMDWIDTRIECADLSAGEFARCEGPGLADDAASQEGFNNKYIGTTDLGSPFVQNTFSCMGGDATRAYNVSVTCQPFISTSYRGFSYEKDVLGVRLTNTLGLNSEIARKIGEGYCAGPISSTVHSPTNVVTVSDGIYDCYATCGEGGCEYRGTAHCECQEVEDDVCAGASAQYMFRSGYESFTCENGVSCDQDCRSETELNKRACYCEINSNTWWGVRENTFNNFLNFFGGAIDVSDQENLGDFCCSNQRGAGEFSVLSSNIPLDTSSAVCFDGELVRPNNIFDLNTYGDNKLLSYGGKVHYCVEARICPDMSFNENAEPSPQEDHCVFVESDGTCNYKYYGDRSCCDNVPLNCPEYITCGPLASFHHSSCDDYHGKDPLIAQINLGTSSNSKLNHIEDVYASGQVLTGSSYTCDSGSWVVT